MTPMVRDQLTILINEGTRLMGRLKEDPKRYAKQVFLYESQMHHKSYGDELLILSPIAKTLSLITKAQLLEGALGGMMLTLSIAFLKANGPGKETKLVGEALEKYARELTKLFKKSDEFAENLTLLFLGASFALGALALGVEKEGAMDEASDAVKRRVELSQEIAKVYAPLFVRFFLGQKPIETIGGDKALSAALEFAFLGCFIQGTKEKSLFNALLPLLQERASLFQDFAAREEVPRLIGAAVSEIRLALEEEDRDLFIEALDNFVVSLGVDKGAFYKDLDDLHTLVSALAFMISPEKLREVTKEHTRSVQV